ncbi:hypothetical protein [Paraoerskovia marina]|uniref:hypothetical protein n=1 Tax=Paraoerskovia marina TaxID=545619 RepID=UPI000A7C7997|nr:hypothetical protein [Paraoerskovia marina]
METFPRPSRAIGSADPRVLVPRTLPTSESYDPVERAEQLRRVRSGSLVRVRRGVYVHAETGPADGPARARQQHLLRQVRGVTERFTTPYWFSHETAALLWGCWTWRLGTEIHLTQLGRPKVRPEADPSTRRHWTALDPRDRATSDGVPLTSLERTVVDCARTLRPAQALVIADSALRIGADPRGIARCLDAARGRRGVRRARQTLEIVDAASESPGETVVRWMLHDAGLPAMTHGVEVTTRRGLFRLDLADVAAKVAIEFDGAVKYGGAFGDGASKLWAEKQRHDALTEQGWTVIHVTWDELGDTVGLAGRVRTARAAGRREPRA